EDKQILPPAGLDRVNATLIVAELDEQCLAVKLLNDRANLPACKALLGKVRQQRHHVRKGRPFVLRVFFRLHHSTQHVMNRGALSPVRTIQMVPTTSSFSCRLMAVSRRQWVPQASAAIWKASPERAASSRASRNHDASVR